LLFNEQHLFDERSIHDRVGGYQVHGFILPPDLRERVRTRPDGSLWLPHNLTGYAPDRGRAADLGVVDFGAKDYFLGLLATRTKHGFETPSGYVLNGPGALVGDDDGFEVRECIRAICPKEVAWDVDASLDYEPPANER
jgi:hypothetical protein